MKWQSVRSATHRETTAAIYSSRAICEGAPIWIVPVHPDTTWAMRAPAIAGLPQFTDAQAETILERSIGPNGLPIQPPMHIYHMNHADSTAIFVAYLRSMPSAYPLLTEGFRALHKSVSLRSVVSLRYYSDSSSAYNLNIASLIGCINI